MANIRSIDEVRRGGAPADAPADGDDPSSLAQGGTTSGTATMRRATPADLADAARRAAERGDTAAAAAMPSFGRIEVYRNGFIIGDGEFRDAADPENQRVLGDLMQGNVPRSLENEVRAAIEKAGVDPSEMDSVRLDLVDKRTQDYVAPKPQFRAFQGQGFSLAADAGAASAAASGENLSSAPAQELEVDESQPVIQAQVVTSDRKRLRVRMNESHTVRQLYQHVRAVVGGSGSFSLSSGFPPKPLQDGSQSVGDAGLRGASISQKPT